MPLDDLLASLQRECEQECDALLAEARRQCETLRKNAEERKGKVLAEAAVSQRRAWEAEGQNLVYQARLAVEQERSALLADLMGQVFSQALTRLSLLRDDPEYPRIIREWFEESVEGVEHAVTVEADPRDRAALSPLLSGNPAATFKECGPTGGGFRLVSEDGRIIIDSTLEARVKRGRKMLSPTLISMLTSGGDER